MSGAVIVDDLVPLLNPTRQVDLAQVLELTPARVRVAVALAFADLTVGRWAGEAGLEETTVARWITKKNRMPLGAGVRLGRVLGVNPIVLFEFYL